jgi:cytochrome c oxidase cbb3-type subunit 3
MYGNEPAQIYLTIYQGRPRGMPAWGAMLPDNIIWDLVAYVRNLDKAPTTEWGKTFSKQSPQIEQVPAEFLQSSNPWSQTEAFSHGQKPNKAP